MATWRRLLLLPFKEKTEEEESAIETQTVRRVGRKSRQYGKIKHMAEAMPKAGG